jgi:cysteine-rich repeat protein
MNRVAFWVLLGVIAGTGPACFHSLDVERIPCDPTNPTACPSGYVCTQVTEGYRCRRPSDGATDTSSVSSEAGSIDSTNRSEANLSPLDGNRVDTGETAGAEVGGTVRLDASNDATDVPIGAGGTGGIDAPTGTGGAGGAGGTGGIDGASNPLLDSGADQPQQPGIDGGTGGTGGPRTNGSPCLLGPDCDSGSCADGVCCDGACGGCNACLQTMTGKPDGTCAPVLAGSDPHLTCEDETATNQCGNDGLCDGKGFCRKVGTNHVCTPGKCEGTLFTPALTCDGVGACKPLSSVTPTDCGASPCSATDGCQTTCTVDTNCVGDSYCDASKTCHAKKLDGDPCNEGRECSSTYCIDKVCCHTPCSGCNACSNTMTGQPSGTCAAAKIDTDPHEFCSVDNPPCGHDGNCDGAGACKLAASNTPCGVETCDGNTYTPLSHCTGSGACNPVSGDSCPGNLLCGTNNKCKTTCSSTATDCVSGYSCPSAGATACANACGDGKVTGTEQCDDGNTASGDGCSNACQKESGWNCTGTSPTTCTPICGDGVRVGAEGCDDGNTLSGDGCSPLCASESGFTCWGSPSTCAKVIYVRQGASGAKNGTSWPNAYDNLQSALQFAVSGQEIWVAAGTYRPSTSNTGTPFAMRSGVALYGGFDGVTAGARTQRDFVAYETILSGDLSNNDQPAFLNRADNSSTVVSGSSGSNPIVDGFTIAGATAVGISTTGTAKLRNLKVRDCQGIAIQCASSTTTKQSASLSDVRVEGNYGTGIAVSAVGDEQYPCLKRVSILADKGPATDAALSIASTKCSGCATTTMYVNAVNLRIDGYGVGVSVTSSGSAMADVQIANSILSGATKRAVDAYARLDVDGHYYATQVRLTNTAVINNSVGTDSGASIFSSYKEGSGVCSIKLYNSIVYGNTFYALSAGTFSAATSCVQPGCTANLDANYRPLGGPPLGDAGNGSAAGLTDSCDLDEDGNSSEGLPFDLDGKPRIAGSAIDIGPFEYQ